MGRLKKLINVSKYTLPASVAATTLSYGLKSYGCPLPMIREITPYNIETDLFGIGGNLLFYYLVGTGLYFLYKKLSYSGQDK